MDERAEADGMVPQGALEVLFTDMSGRPVTLDQRVRHHLSLLVGDLRVAAARNGHAVQDDASIRLLSGTQTMQDGDAAQQQQSLPDGPRVHYVTGTRCGRCNAFGSATLTVRAGATPDQGALDAPEEQTGVAYGHLATACEERARVRDARRQRQTVDEDGNEKYGVSEGGHALIC